MPDAIHTQIATDLQVSDTPQPQVELPADIQYMPPGRHTINATRNKQPVTVDITADQNAATTLNAWLQDRLESAAAGSEDRPFFDFNHEDREAAAWPTEFYWAGDDPITGGIRAKVEWSGAGEEAIRKRTFRRFSPTFIPDADGRVIGSETNMGGLVNRAAFKTIQPLFAKKKN
jgi:phage I-like protein